MEAEAKALVDEGAAQWDLECLQQRSGELRVGGRKVVPTRGEARVEAARRDEAGRRDFMWITRQLRRRRGRGGRAGVSARERSFFLDGSCLARRPGLAVETRWGGAWAALAHKPGCCC
jgi:hypothetical protein